MQKIQLLAILLLTLVLVGCGTKGLKTNYVEGIVTLDGKPLEGAFIQFIPAAADGKTASGLTDETGKYTLMSDGGGAPDKGALAGDYIVTIAKQHVEERAPRVVRVDPAADPRSGPRSESIVTLITPKQYSEQKTTTLKATVKKGKNKIPFEMTSK